MRRGIAGLLLVAFVACGGKAPKQGREREPYVVNYVTADPSNNGITLVISVNSPATEESVKSVAEQVIAKYKSQYQNITVKSYPAGSDQSGVPYATSMFTDGSITHTFNPQALPQKIPTH